MTTGLTNETNSDHCIQYVHQQIDEYMQRNDGLNKPYVFIHGIDKIYLILKTGKTKQVETLERIENPVITEDIQTEILTEITSGPSAITPCSNARPRIAQLASRQADIRLNQRGVSYKSLFSDYIRTAKKITIVDPFIRVGHIK